MSEKDPILEELRMRVDRIKEDVDKILKILNTKEEK